MKFDSRNTAELMAIIANRHRGKSERTYKAEDFLKKNESKTMSVRDMKEQLKEMYGDRIVFKTKSNN